MYKNLPYCRDFLTRSNPSHSVDAHTKQNVTVPASLNSRYIICRKVMPQ